MLLSLVYAIPVLHTTSVILLDAKAKFVRGKPSVVFTLEEVSEMC